MEGQRKVSLLLTRASILNGSIQGWGARTFTLFIYEAEIYIRYIHTVNKHMQSICGVSNLWEGQLGKMSQSTITEKTLRNTGLEESMRIIQRIFVKF